MERFFVFDSWIRSYGCSVDNFDPQIASATQFKPNYLNPIQASIQTIRKQSNKQDSTK
jgi:hypothetical protein